MKGNNLCKYYLTEFKKYEIKNKQNMLRNVIQLLFILSPAKL